MSKAIPLLNVCALMTGTGTILPLPLPCGRTIRVNAQSIRNPLSPQHNTENVDLKKTCRTDLKTVTPALGRLITCAVQAIG
jgi:hypothetical protein